MERIIAGVSSLSCQMQHNQGEGRGGGRVIDNYEKQTGNQIHIITTSKNQCYASDVIII